jgi:hypothetical protein
MQHTTCHSCGRTVADEADGFIASLFCDAPLPAERASASNWAREAPKRATPAALALAPRRYVVPTENSIRRQEPEFGKTVWSVLYCSTIKRRDDQHTNHQETYR